MFKAFNSWKNLRFQKCTQTVLFQKQHGAEKNHWPGKKQTLISFYKQNPILRDNADPNYKNKVKRSLIKVKLVTIFDGKLSDKFLEKCFSQFVSSFKIIGANASTKILKLTSLNSYKIFKSFVSSLISWKNE